METGLEGKPWWYGAAVGAAIGIAVAGLFWYNAIQPKIRQIESERQQLIELQDEISKGRAAQKNLPRFREEIRVLELELEKLLRILPGRRNVQEIMRNVRQLVERGDFHLKRFRPGNERDQDFFSEWPITINLDGSYHNLALFFDRVSRFSRIVNVDNLNLTSRNEAGGHTLSASFTAKTFIYKEPVDYSEEEGDDF